jgi:anti-sigma factor RsiW
MTDCPNGELRDLLPLLAHDALDAAEAARVREHVATCAECRAELALLDAVRAQAVAATPVVSVSAILAGVQRATADTAGSATRGVLRALPAKRRSAWVPQRYAAAAASLVLVASVSLAVVGRTWFGGGDPTQSGADSVMSAAASVVAGGGLSVPGGLSEYDTDELNALLSALDAMEATVEAEPVSFRQPILDAPEGG